MEASAAPRSLRAWTIGWTFPFIRTRRDGSTGAAIRLSAAQSEHTNVSTKDTYGIYAACLETSIIQWRSVPELV